MSNNDQNAEAWIARVGAEMRKQGVAGDPATVADELTRQPQFAAANWFAGEHVISPQELARAIRDRPEAKAAAARENALSKVHSVNLGAAASGIDPEFLAGLKSLDFNALKPTTRSGLFRDWQAKNGPANAAPAPRPATAAPAMTEAQLPQGARLFGNRLLAYGRVRAANAAKEEIASNPSLSSMQRAHLDDIVRAGWGGSP